MDDVRLLSATRLAALIRSGAMSSREIVEAHIAQIERVNGTLNAVVSERFEQARAEADQADARRQRDDAASLPPFHGVPCTIKECFALAGMPNTSGLVRRRGVVADQDATAVARMRGAGAIPLGVTNTSELCMWIESSNRVYGRSNNPYDPTRIVGGSSGGEGAIIGAAGSPIGLGSDVGGSIRGPAFFNGVFGHKPSGGLVPGTGQYPIAENRALSYLTTGPLARRAEDLMPLLRVLAGPDGLDQGCRAFTLEDPSEVRLAGRTLLNVEDNGKLPVCDELREAQERAVRALEARGMRVVARRFPALERQTDIWSAALSAESTTTFAALLGGGEPVRLLPEFLRWSVGRSDHTLIALLLALAEKVATSAASSKRMLALCEELRGELDAALADGALMLYPSFDRPAPKHHDPVLDALRLHMPWSYMAIINVLELPATQVPLGLGAEGLPLGVQVIGRRGGDGVTLAAALALEADCGGWQPPALAGLPAPRNSAPAGHA